MLLRYYSYCNRKFTKLYYHKTEYLMKCCISKTSNRVTFNILCCRDGLKHKNDEEVVEVELKISL